MLLRPILIYWFTVSLIWSGLMGLKTTQARAEIATIQFIPPQTEEESDPRDRPRGGGSRPMCNPSDPEDLRCTQRSMVAIVPQTTSNQAAWGLSRSATPMIWIYSPFEREAPIPSAFELTNEAGQVIWQDANVPFPSKSGIFSYQIPSQAHLTPGETYRWHLTVQLDPEQPAADVLLSARLTYQPQSQNAPQQSNSRSWDHIQTLARQGIWYDTVTALAQMSPNNQTIWQDFLSQNGFSDLTQEAILAP